MNNAVEEIKSRLSAVEVIGNYVKLEKSGGNFKGLSPFSNEKTPSFYVSEDKNLYHCFSTGKGGDIFSFIQEMEGVDFKESLRILADQAGVDLTKYRSNFDKNDNSNLYKILDNSREFYCNNLKTNTEALDYLTARNINKKTIDSWSIGLAKDNWNDLTNFLTKRFKDNELVDSGMVIKNEKGRIYDRFRGRIMFPILDPQGKTVAFSGRKIKEELETDKNGGKYINSPETSLFHKSKVLFGYFNAKNTIRKLDFAILVEGQFDVILAHQVGYTNTIATSGTAFTKNHAEIIKRLTNNLVIAYDMDKAGIEASRKAWIEALSSGFDVKIAVLPDGSDPADLISQNPEKWKLAVKEASHVIEFLINNLIKENINRRTLFKKIESQIFGYINLISSDLEKRYFLKKISEITDLPSQTVFEAFDSFIKNNPVENSIDVKSLQNMDIITSRLKPVDVLVAILEEERYNKNPRFNFETLENVLNTIIPLDLLNKTKEELKSRTDISFILEIYIKDKEKLKSKIIDLLHQLKIDLLKNKRSQLKDELKKDSSNTSILSEINKINKEIDLINNKEVEEINL